MTERAELPVYAQDAVREHLLSVGASGTVYAMVMPESESALGFAMDGCDQKTTIEGHEHPTRIQQARNLAQIREANVLSRYREPWTRRQDEMHKAYLDGWIEWSRPVVSFDPDAFTHRYPTAGASEGIFKLMSEHAATQSARGGRPQIAIFHGEYEGFPQFAESLSVGVKRIDRSRWREELALIPRHAQFWISQPSAIDGSVWEDFDEFLGTMCEERPDVSVVPDLSYVGAVARDYSIDVGLPCVDAFVFSHSKPFGGYYHRAGGVFARDLRRSLFGNVWFKNLMTLAWGVEMMKRHGVHDLPRRYRSHQEKAAASIGTSLGLPGLAPADVMLLGTAPADQARDDVARSLLRGYGSERVVRVCLTPMMSRLVDERYAPSIVGIDA